MSCPRCGGPCEPIELDELTTHWTCADADCQPPGLYANEHPVKFWAMFLVELAMKLSALIYYRFKRW